MIKSILVVCVGNICRSPVGERSLQARVPTLDIKSAGIAALVGHSADEASSRAAAEHGVSLAEHKARQFTVAMATDYDLILVMEAGHKREIVKLAPHLSGKIMLFDHWNGSNGIPDPYRKPIEVHHDVVNLILAAAEMWAIRLNGKSNEQ
jgi:protein-tyrosine phosphatase